MGIISDLIYKAYCYQNGIREDENKEMTNEEAIAILEEVAVIDDSMYAYNNAYNKALSMAIEALRKQTPRPVESDIDRTWGIHKRVPVCPRCESFLTVTHFIGDGKKISYCDHCGQAVDWEEWEYDE